MECNHEVARSAILMKWLMQDSRELRVFLMDMDDYILSCGVLVAAIQSKVSIYPFVINTQLDKGSIDRMLDRIHTVYNSSSGNKTVVFINFQFHNAITKGEVTCMIDAYNKIYKLLSVNNDRCIVHVTSDNSISSEIMEDYFIMNCICDTQATNCPYIDHVTVSPIKKTDANDVYRCDIGYFTSVHLVVDDHKIVIPLSNINVAKTPKLEHDHRIELALPIVG